MYMTKMENNVYDWNEELDELNAFFSDIIITDPIRVGKITTINCFKQMVKTHISYCRSGKKIYLPYLQRLRYLKTYLSHGIKKPD
jgi:hypothetical protein